MRGALWYQGESNLGQGIEYVHRMRALIAGWRTVWGQGDFPFYFVQLAPYVYSPDRAQKLPEVWVAQTRVTSLVTNTGMAVINDIGNPKDIHPRNKRDVGRRLSLLALNRTYGRGTGEDSGPLYAGYEREGGAITVRFAHTGGGLVARDGQALTLFEIAGEDDVFVPATAEIAKDGKSVRVSSAQVAQPRAVRFAWDNVASPNLMNREGLPASAFHTHWPEDRELGVNLVRGRDYKSSDPNVAGWDKPGLTDGVWGEDAKTCYASGNKDAFPKTVELDLGAGATVRAVRLGVPKFGSTRTVEVSTSEDGTTFVPLGRKEFAQGTAQRVLLTGAPRTARWVRVTFPDHHDARVGYDPTFVFVSELEVFGDAGK
jgi:sialate O-acetylesterase